MRLYKGHDIKQVYPGCSDHESFSFRLTTSTSLKVSDKLKSDVPDHVKEQAREMARQELARRLEELNMTSAEAKGYGALLDAVQSHIALLFDLFERERRLHTYNI